MPKTVLIIDDEPSMTEVYRLILEEEGHNCLLASDALAGLDLISSIRAPELILLDCSMPGMSGGEFIDVLSERYPKVRAQSRVVAFTLMDPKSPMLRPYLDRLDGYVGKPSTLDGFAEMVRTELALHAASHQPREVR